MLVAVLASVGAHAQAPPTTPPGVVAYRDLVYAHILGTSLKLDLFVPDITTPETPAPLIVWIHGGGWSKQSKTNCLPFRANFMGRGYAVASVDYRLSDNAKFPAQLQDCKAAIRWLRANAAKYDLATDRISAWGSSAGGHLAMLLGLTAGKGEFDVGAHLDVSSNVQAVVNYYGPVDLTGKHVPAGFERIEKYLTALFGGPVVEKMELAASASPLTYVTKNAAPLFIIHGTADKTVNVAHAKGMHEAMTKAGVPCKIALIESAGHGGKPFRDKKLLDEVDTFFAAHLKSSAPSAKDFAWLLRSMRDEHPRVFISKENLDAVKTRALGVEQRLYEAIKANTGALVGQKIEFKDIEIADGTQSRDHEYGFRAADAALVWLVDQDPASLALAKSLLRELGSYYNQRNRVGRNIHWFAYTRIASLAAFDWIYSALTPEERLAIGRPLLEAVSVMAIRDGRKLFLRENTGDHTTGFYGPPCLAWYAGLVFHKTGIDDALALKLLQKGFDDHIKLLAHRARIYGRAGGAASPTVAYASGNYPWAEFNFFHTLQSATGCNIASEWPHPLRFYYYLYWHWLPGNLGFGFGDEEHSTNALTLGQLRAHLSQMAHFYGDSAPPQFMALARWMFANAGPQIDDRIPFTRFLLSRFNPKSFIKDVSTATPPLRSLPSAVFFKSMGQVSMRSGSGSDDTYALFTSGGLIKNHKHYDNNNFVIYKNGFRALDTGTRPEPGQHLTHYYCRTIAHNCVLIKMPGETFPRYWGGPAASEEPLPVPNDGGQRNLLDSTVTAFSQNHDYVYVASDATGSYHPDKAALVLRQFVFVQPDIFLIFDKVTSTRAEYKKTWLLHTASEPQMLGPGEFSEASGEGRLFCRTLFPKNASLAKTGGPGKQFWSDERNWPLPVLTPDDWNYRNSAHKQTRDDTPLFGQWRVEVSPVSENTHDEFLHLIQVGNLSLGAMIPVRRLESDDVLGAEFEYDGRRYKITFKRGPEHGGAITITRDGIPIVDELFTQTVEESCAPF